MIVHFFLSMALLNLFLAFIFLFDWNFEHEEEDFLLVVVNFGLRDCRSVKDFGRS